MPSSSRSSRQIRTAGRRRPSWKTSVASGGIEPGFGPPMSSQWAVAIENATRASAKNTGLMMVTSQQWVPPVSASLVANTSPGRIRPRNLSITWRSCWENVPVNSVMPLPWAIRRPCASAMPQAKSSTS